MNLPDQLTGVTDLPREWWEEAAQPQKFGAMGGAAVLVIALVVGVMLAVLTLNFVFLLGASLIDRALGKTGIVVVTRLLGMLLAALAVQFIIDGLHGSGFGLPFPGAN